jgi:rfaE bifunctional protein nucleotidyltransferase chain/domain
MGMIISDGLEDYVQSWKAEQKKIVLSNGCFDLLHIGHLRTFQQSKMYGDILVIGVNSDRSVRALKGPTRPLNNEADRAELVAALKPVDFVVIFDELTADRLLERVKPDLYVKGGDYTRESLPEYATLERLGIKTQFIPLVAGISTTALVKKIQG